VERWYQPVHHGEAVVIGRGLPKPRGVADETILSIEDECDSRAREQVANTFRVVLVRERSR